MDVSTLVVEGEVGEKYITVLNNLNKTIVFITNLKKILIDFKVTNYNDDLFKQNFLKNDDDDSLTSILSIDNFDYFFSQNSCDNISNMLSLIPIIIGIEELTTDEKKYLVIVLLGLFGSIYNNLLIIMNLLHNIKLYKSNYDSLYNKMIQYFKNTKDLSDDIKSRSDFSLIIFSEENFNIIDMDNSLKELCDLFKNCNDYTLDTKKQAELNEKVVNFFQESSFEGGKNNKKIKKIIKKLKKYNK